MTDTSTKRAEEVARIHEVHAKFSEPLTVTHSTQLRPFREETATLLRALAAERDALLSKLSKRDALHTQDLLAVQAWREANFSSTPWPPKERLVSCLLDEMTALRISLSAAVSEGHVVVPRVATEEMRLMGLKQFHEFEYATPSEIWTAMVEAALGEKQ